MTRWRFSMAGAILAAVLGLAVSLPSASAQASTIPAPTGAVCVITVTNYSVDANGNDMVSGTTDTCYANLANYKAARQAQLATPDAAEATVNVGYGCTAANFGGTCYYFATPGNCPGGGFWYWNTLGTQTDNRLASMESFPMSGCSYAVVYSLPYLTGQSIGCYNTCYGLGTISGHDESLIIGA